MPRIRKLHWEEFWGSYNLYGSHFDYDPALVGTLDMWKRLSFIQCGKQEWVKDIPDDDTEKEMVIDKAICLDTSSMVLKNGTFFGGKRLMLDLYGCQPDSPVPCDNKFTGKFFFSFAAYTRTIDVKKFNNPFKLTNKKLQRVMPQQTIRYNSDIQLKWTDLFTGVGNFSTTWEQKKIVTVFRNVMSASQKTMSNIMWNFSSQGRLIMSDFDWHLELFTSNDKTEIYRHYFSVLDIFSAVGGL